MRAGNLPTAILEHGVADHVDQHVAMPGDGDREANDGVGLVDEGDAQNVHRGAGKLFGRVTVTLRVRQHVAPKRLQRRPVLGRRSSHAIRAAPAVHVEERLRDSRACGVDIGRLETGRRRLGRGKAIAPRRDRSRAGVLGVLTDQESRDSPEREDDDEDGRDQPLPLARRPASDPIEEIFHVRARRQPRTRSSTLRPSALERSSSSFIVRPPS